MAILTRNTPPVAKPSYVKTPDAVSVSGPRYRGVSVDTRYVDRSALLTHLEGQAWIVRYFNQQVSGNDALSAHQFDRDATYQQYLHIENFEIKVTSELTYSQALETKSAEVRGAALIYPPVIPNTGDLFLADCGDGQEGVFSVTQSQRLSLLAKTAYEIEYVLLSYSSAEYRTDLYNKSIKTVRFVKELLERGEQPLLIEAEYDRLLTAQTLERRLLSHYLGRFYEKQIQSLAVPGQTQLTYDPFVVNLLLRVFNSHDHRLIGSLKPYVVKRPGTSVIRTLWDAVAGCSLDELPHVNEKLAIFKARCFSNVPRYEGVGFSQIQDVVYPVDAKNPASVAQWFQSVAVDERDIRHQFQSTYLGDFSQLNRRRIVGFDAQAPIYPVTKDDYYVLSEAFYFDQAGPCSQLELLVKQALTDQTFSLSAVFDLCEASYKWGGLERFYYTPLLLCLLRFARYRQSILNQSAMGV
jgi:hypothetical protein